MAASTSRGRRSRWSRWRSFVARYGWRAYALPILVFLTLGAVLQPAVRGRRFATRAPLAARMQHRAGASTAPPVDLLPVEIDSTACLTNRYARLVLVSISQQHAWMCHGRRQVNSSPVTTGNLHGGDATPTGSWTVQGKQTDRYLTGPGYRDFVHYWIPFDGDIGFHDATWQRMPFGSPGYATKGSHGCVHLPMVAVSWLYGWVSTGSTVVTVQQ